MKKYFVTVVTQYDGYEWCDKQLMEAKDKREVKKHIYEAGYFVHDNGIEIVDSYSIKELTDAEYNFLKCFI